MERKRNIPWQFWSITMCVLFVVGSCNGGTVKKVMSVGDNTTFDCYPPRYSANHVKWSSSNSQNPTELDIVLVDLGRGEESTYLYPNIQGNRYSSNFVKAWTNRESKFTMSIRNLTVEDSSNYVCQMVSSTRQTQLMQYEIVVIGCECTLDDTGLDQRLSCAIDGYQSTSSERLTTIVTMGEEVTERNGTFQINELSIPVQTDEISRITSIEFNPLSHKSFQSLVSCSLPKFKTSLNPDVSTIPSSSTGLMSLPPHTTISNVPEDASSKISLTTKSHIKPKSNTGTIVATVVGILLLSVVATVVVLFLYRRKCKCGALGNVAGIPDDEKAAGAVEVKGVYYASVQRHRGDTSTHVYARSIEKTKAESEESIGGAHHQNQHRHREEESPNEGFVDNMLYQSTDMMPADTEATMEIDSPLYAMPDKPMKSGGSGFTKLSATETAKNDDCSSIGRYPPRAGRYSAVDLSVEHNAGTSADVSDPHDKRVKPTDTPTEDCDVALLYAVPDKGPRASINGDVDSTHAEGACSLTLSRDATEDFGQLYAQVDKRRKTLQK